MALDKDGERGCRACVDRRRYRRLKRAKALATPGRSAQQEGHGEHGTAGVDGGGDLRPSTPVATANTPIPIPGDVRDPVPGRGGPERDDIRARRADAERRKGLTPG
jgi:hypothetical protein